MRILGVDPGSRLLGFAVIDVTPGKPGATQILTHGTLIDQSGEIETRLLSLFQGLQKIIQQYQPQSLAIEKIFFAKNVLSALKLGQARGVVLLAAAEGGLSVSEYAPTEIKKAIAGHGHADKESVKKWLKILTKETEFQTLDASDALAIALCHAASLSPNNAARTRRSSSRGLAHQLKHRIE